jgi:predicted metalloprotease
VLGMNPLSMLGGGSGVAPTTQVASRGDGTELTDIQRLSLRVLGSTERRWGDIFAQAGARYTPTTLVFYDRSGQSGCGAAQAAMGPFYCPADNKVYLDTSFFDELNQRFGAPGDFAQAYVIAHEVGHHIQTLEGTSAKVRAAQQRASEAESNALQVKMELQADCYAGVWAARDQNLLEPGDVEEGLRAAQAIGDDTLQRQAQGRVVPESFTHGTSAQRQQWLKRGLDTGDPAQCDTFAA